MQQLMGEDWKAKTDAALAALGIPSNLRQLLVANNVGLDEIQTVVGARGYFPADMPGEGLS